MESLKCEKCGGKLKLENENCVCVDCGSVYSFVNEEENQVSTENQGVKSDKKLIIVLLSIVVLAFGLVYWFASSTINSEKERKIELTEIIGNTCFDEYNQTISFKGYAFGEVVETFYNLNPEYNKIKYHCDTDIPLYHKIDEYVTNFDRKNLNYVSCSLNWSFSNDTTNNERYDILFSVNKKTNEVIPVATSTDGLKWEYSEYPSDVVTAYYMILGTSLKMEGVEIENKGIEDSQSVSAENDPDMPYCLTGLGTVKNSDGTYSFKGYITAYKFNQYSTNPTIYITAENGKEFSTGASEQFRHLYYGKDGEISVILNDILDNPQNLKGLLFVFTYDKNENIVEIRRDGQKAVPNKVNKSSNTEVVEEKKLSGDNEDNIQTVTAKHILVKDENIAENILARINNGEDFDKLMFKYTEDIGTQNNPDGYTFARGVMVKEFEDASFSLKVGEVSGIVKSDYGYHIIKRVK